MQNVLNGQAAKMDAMESASSTLGCSENESICHKCKTNKTAYRRNYSGEALCSFCFSDSIVKKTAKTISKYNMINPGDTVGVAVSGGKDSLSLLHVLHRISTEYKRNFSLKAITVDEGIPGYRDEALELVQEFCGRLGIEYGVYSYSELFGTTIDEALSDRDSSKTIQIKGTIDYGDSKDSLVSSSTSSMSSLSSYPTSCSFCGTLRRRALDVGARDLGVDSIATAHNLDDSLQTFLINMMHGDVSKIGWMHPDTSDSNHNSHEKQDDSAPRKIKPFCQIYENEIVFYAFSNDIPFQSEECPHMNEGIRTPIRKFLNSLEKEHAGLKNSMFQSALKISDTLNNLQKNETVTAKSRQTCKVCGGTSTGIVCSVCQSIEQIRSWKDNSVKRQQETTADKMD